MASEAAEPARAILSDHDAVAATFTCSDGQVLDGWVVFTRELGLRDSRSAVRGTFWYDWAPADGLIEVNSTGTVEYGDQVRQVKTIGSSHTMSAEPSLDRIDFLDARHMRD